MGFKFWHIAVIFVVALVAIAAANKIPFIGNIVG